MTALCLLGDQAAVAQQGVDLRVAAAEGAERLDRWARAAHGQNLAAEGLAHRMSRGRAGGDHGQGRPLGVRAQQLTGNFWAEDPGCYLSDAEVGAASTALAAADAAPKRRTIRVAEMAAS